MRVYITQRETADSNLQLKLFINGIISIDLKVVEIRHYIKKWKITKTMHRERHASVAIT